MPVLERQPNETIFADLDNAQPIRAELFGIEHLENHARVLAEQMREVRVEAGRPLVRLFLRNTRLLQQSHQTISRAHQDSEPLGHDAEWLLDNYHIISDAITEVRTDLPQGFYRWLPKLASGPLRGFPRVYAIAVELTAHSDSSLDENNLSHFLQAFQSVSPLTVGELWAVPIMLRLCMLENLRRLAQQITLSRQHRLNAFSWMQANLPTIETCSSRVHFGIDRVHHDWVDCYTTHLLETLHSNDAASPQAAERLQNCLDQAGQSTQDVLRREKERQAANQVSIGNCVTSLRLLSALDWARFFERHSFLEETLRRDPAGVYAKQDFATRDSYRQIVEHIAEQSLGMAQRHHHETDGATRHVGYYLIDKGRRELEAASGYRAPWNLWFKRFLLAHPQTFYFGGLAALMLLLSGALAACLLSMQSSVALTITAVLLAVIPMSELAVSLMNFLVPWLVPPRVLPKLDHQDGTPGENPTFVVIPSLVTSPQSASSLVERLEVHYLSNPDENLFFGLLTDFEDADAQNKPDDADRLTILEKGIQSLNEKYPRGERSRFFLLHRRREWNPVENCWMGWERKRGKLIEFNRLLLHDNVGSFITVVGDLSKLPRIRFVITLDADTQLPREAARKLIATLAHPLNRPRFDRSSQRVVRGYSVLQPRIGLSLRGARRSPFARLFSGSAGLDPYTTAISDLYQDLFGSGSFTGKGIYDLSAFETATGGIFPENRILSHDLIEGNYARCGLVTDVELLDDFPSHYQAYSKREHRWARGDWQIAAWMRNSVPSGDGTAKRNALGLLDRWKILDNLRRTLVPITMMSVLFVGWIALPGTWWSTVLVGLILAAPLYLMVIGWLGGGFVRAMNGKPFGRPAGLGATFGQVVLSAVFLLDRTWSMMDAIGRTLYRLTITRRHLLEWETAASTERRLHSSLGHFIRSMGPVSLAALAMTGLILLVAPESLLAASPFLVAWFGSPLIAWAISRPNREGDEELSKSDRTLLRHWSRKTWNFFETFVGEEDNWLPPDNFQEEPKEIVAHRTSPTNIGLYLLSCVAAHDLGYLSLSALLDRIEATLATIDKLERPHGHLCNWYDTRTLEPLHPIYLSTVDSGNLAASLVTLKQSLLEKTRTPIWGAALLNGLNDTLDVAEETLTKTLRGNPLRKKVADSFVAQIAALRSHINQPVEASSQRRSWLNQLIADAEGLHDGAKQRSIPRDAQESTWLNWARKVAELATARGVEGRMLVDSQETSDPAVATEAITLDQLAASGSRPGDSEHLTALSLRNRCLKLAEHAENLADAMDFRMLYNRERNLFAIGYNMSAGRIDSAHYDLLASEACLTSFLTVARGDVPKKHWFHLGRPLTRASGSLVLLSWGGTMFEYLMPRLFMKLFRGTLIEESQRGAVDVQIKYGRRCRRPWGISESAYNAVDGQWNYQYQAFGVPGLGLKRGLSQDLVVAPYATALAVMTHSHEVVKNYKHLCREGADGRFGLFEAIDYTADRLPPNQSKSVVKCFMAHHQGMSLVALSNRLLGNPVHRRFHAEAYVKATELLLQERLPKDAAIAESQLVDLAYQPNAIETTPPMNRRLTTPHTVHPRTHLLASERYSLMITNAGSGQSTARGLAVTRWREDRTCDAWGQFIYIRDLRTHELWSAGYQPVCKEPDEYEVTFAGDKVEFRRVDGALETRMEITISPENHAEVRRLTITNHDNRSHSLEVTSYAEVVLASQAADLAHPAFGKLFLETEFLPATEALLCRRRPRSHEEKPIWGLHVLAVEGRSLSPVQYETDRAKFLGRCRTPADPAALDRDSGPLSGTVGPVLDPIFSLRRRVRIKAGASASMAFTTALADSREEALSLADRYHDYHGINRAFELAWAHAQVELRQLHLTAGETYLYQRLAGHLIYAGPTLRAPANLLAANRLGQSSLWRHGISGDLPIVLAVVGEVEELPLARQLIAAHAFWRLKGLVADLVIINEQDGGYFEDFQQQIQSLVRISEDRGLLDKPGGVHLRKASHLSSEDRVLLQAAAHVALIGSRGALAGQLDRFELHASPMRRSAFSFPKKKEQIVSNAPLTPTPELLFDNGTGGFTPDGKEYVLHLFARNGRYNLPPQPWINVIANREFGAVVSDSGGGNTWYGNSQSNRVTPWQNDPVSDIPGEIVYLRDELTEKVWSATPEPLGTQADFLVRHGQGYTVFEHSREQLAQALTIFVPPDAPVKIFRLKLLNGRKQARRIDVAFYANLVLGRSRDREALHVVTELDAPSGALLARNPFRPDYADHVAFADINVRPRTFTTDRTEFIGRNGSIDAPVAFEEDTLTERVGAALDPCFVLRTTVLVPANGESEIAFLLGETTNIAEARRLVNQFREANHVQHAWEACKSFSEQLLNALTIRTPNTALDLLANRWLPYQVLNCRMWGRTALYQSGGAYGFRDQLQDSLALVYCLPEEARTHILRAAGHQFTEGDVQHWWHPPSGAGVRTRFSDDFLWLPFVVEHYVRVTGDVQLLDERAGFLRAPRLNPGQEDDYRVPDQSDETGTIFEHCLRAIDNGLKFGVHGLPLMGSGDWNDGMNRVGLEGRGESVWNAWFLLTILKSFATLCDSRGELERASQYRRQSELLRRNLEQHAWDGEWYRRAFFDDGMPLGSKDNDECRIDSLPQSWAVISGEGDPERARQAMEMVNRELVRRQEKLVLLFTPPFDQGQLQPGYIKGYVPGIRENGGQYTHAAVWVAQAFALLGDGDRAMEIIDLMNPIFHSSTPEEVEKFRLEPYVIPADVYSQPPHVGRGGWSWYTGSAGWFYRVIVETLLGFEKRGNSLRIVPRVPSSWPGYEMTFRHCSSTYHIQVGRSNENPQYLLDGNPLDEGEIPLVDDGRQHEIIVRLR